LPPILLPNNTDFVVSLEYIGKPYGRRRYKSSDGDRIYEWDTQHGEFEVYNKRGRHLAVYNEEGEFIKNAEKGRKIDV
jgi:hypothetical protein